MTTITECCAERAAESKKEALALKYFGRNKKLYTDMAECVSRGAAKILYAGRDGVLLYEKSSGIHMLASEEKAAAKRILKRWTKTL